MSPCSRCQGRSQAPHTGHAPGPGDPLASAQFLSAGLSGLALERSPRYTPGPAIFLGSAHSSSLWSICEGKHREGGLSLFLRVRPVPHPPAETWRTDGPHGTAADAGEPRAGGIFGGHMSSDPAWGPLTLQGRAGPRTDRAAWTPAPDAHLPPVSSPGLRPPSPRPAWHPRPQSDRPRPPRGFHVQLSRRVRASGGQPGSAPSRLALLRPAQRWRAACGAVSAPHITVTWPSLCAPPAGPQGASGSSWPGTPHRRRATAGQTQGAAAAGSWINCPCPFNGVRGRGLRAPPCPSGRAAGLGKPITAVPSIWAAAAGTPGLCLMGCFLRPEPCCVPLLISFV